MAAQQISSRRTHRSRQIKHAEDPPTFLLRKQIGNERGSERHKRCFSDPNQRVTNQQLRVSVRNRCEQREPAPEDRASDNNSLARIAISQWPNERRRNHVEDKKCTGEI